MDISYKKVINLSESVRNCYLIYFLINDGEIVYVGQSNQVTKRLIAHTKSNKIFDSISAIAVSPEDANDVEAKCIVKFNPVYNLNLPKCNIYKSTADMVSRDVEACKDLTPVYIEKVSWNSSKESPVYLTADVLKACKQKSYRDRKRG